MRAFILTLVLISTASAQGYIIQPGPNLGGIQYLGNVGNTPVFNPWNMYNNQNYSGNLYITPIYPPYPRPWPCFPGVPYQPYPIYNPYVYNPYPIYPYNPALFIRNNVINQAVFNRLPAMQGTSIERAAGTIIPVNAGLAVNPTTGTTINPLTGVANTAEGTFVRIPGTGGITAFGTYNPQTGTYVNPITGDLYNPGSGLILRR